MRYGHLLLITAAALLAACGSSDDDSPLQPTPTLACPDTAGVVRATFGTFDDDATASERRVVLMGGGSEVDPAARTFAESAEGGDMLVLRATGSVTSHNAWFREELGAQPAPASVTTLRIEDPAMSASSTVLCYVGGAEAIWLAGGDQWDYLGEWSAPLHEALASLPGRGVPVGGTSAGAMALGEAAFDAQHGSVTSGQALLNPLREEVSVSLSPFAQPELDGWIVDSHFTERGREGRLIAFLAHMQALTGRDTVYGIGLDEWSSIVIGNGTYEVVAGGAQRVRLYRLDVPVTMVAGEPLDVDHVLRVELRHTDSGEWPASFEGADTVRVSDGVIAP